MSALLRYIETLKLFQESKIPFVVTGTFALYLQENKFSEYYCIKDCDVFIEYDRASLSSFVTIMREHDWSVRLWEEEADLLNIMEQAEGKYYIRCTKNDLVFDATYEHDEEIFGDPVKDRIYVNNIPVIAAEKILKGKKYRGTEKDLQVVSWFEKSQKSC